MSILRGYQRDLKTAIYKAWGDGAKHVMGQLSTGGGKTVIIGEIIREHDGYSCAMAHRSELVTQISTALAREGVRHDIVASKATVRGAVNNHMDACGRSYYDPRAKCKVASVDTIIRRRLDVDWLNKVGLVIPDEAHHVLRDNKWGRAVAMFPNARGFFPTATPMRADRKGLGSHHDGLADALIEGPPMRWLIEQGYLTDYRVMCPEASDLDMSDVHVTPGGEYNQHEVSRAVKRSTKIVADVVDTYKTHAMGKLGITFAVDIEEAGRLTAAFNAAGVPAALVTAETPDDERRAILRRFKSRQLLQLVNVDLFGEGFDLPAIECVSMARPTASFALFAQQFGRALRLMISPILMAAWDTYSAAQRLAFIAASEKPFALIFDHVGNIQGNSAKPQGHGLPDRQMPWSLDRGSKRAKSTAGAIPLRVCVGTPDQPGCQRPYERILDVCPFCGMPAPLPTLRNGPEFVDGNLLWLDDETLRKMRGQVSRIDGQFYPPSNVPPIAVAAAAKRHHERQVAQAGLREAIAVWAGLHADAPDSVNYRRFWFEFGIDVLSAQALGAREADELRGKVVEKLALANVANIDYPRPKPTAGA